MKKAVAMFLAVVMAVGLAACGGGSSQTSDNSSGGASGDAAQVADAGSDSSYMTTAEAALDDGEPVYGGELNMYWQEFYNNYDPSVMTNRNYCLFYEQLWTIDWGINDPDTYAFNSKNKSMEYYTGQIADTWEFDADAQTLTVKIRDDIYFQTKEDEQYNIYNGRNLVASDVAYSYDRLLGLDGVEKVEAEMDWASTLSMLESVETTDDYTVVFHFNSGSEVALNSFITNPICIAGPEWDELTDDQKSDWHYACGTGPYILTDYVADSYMTFTKNENYYDYDERYPENKLPYIDTINLIAISDTSNQLSQFIAGQLDMIGWSSLTLNDSEAKQIEAALDRSDFYVNTFYANAVGLQLKQCYEPFQNQKVRQAMQMAVDLETITTDYYGYSADSLQVFGLFDPTTSLSDVDNWSDEIKAGYTYDPEGAKALLAEAGYPDGFSFDVTLFAAQDSDLYTLVATQLAQVGITMNISIVSTPQEMQAVGAQLDNPACISGEICLSTILAANDTYTTGAAFNNMGLSDEKLDSMITAAKDSATMDDLVAAAHEIDDYAAEQHYTLQFSPKEQIKQYFSSKVKGYTGESIYTDWNAGTILPRLWVATEE